MNTDEIKGLKLGDRVLFTHRLERKSEHRALTTEPPTNHPQAHFPRVLGASANPDNPAAVLPQHQSRIQGSES